MPGFRDLEAVMGDNNDNATYLPVGSQGKVLVSDGEDLSWVSPEDLHSANHRVGERNVCSYCGREWNTSKYESCPGCSATETEKVNADPDDFDLVEPPPFDIVRE